MAYDVDYDYEFEEAEDGSVLLPDGMTMDGELYVLPNGKYLPQGAYRMKDGCDLIYEPPQLGFASFLSLVEGNE